MGYYIDFVFDNKKSFSRVIVENKFINAGAKKIPFEEMVKPDKFIELKHPSFLFPIDVFSNESNNQKGSWAHIRLSWGTDIDKFRAILLDLIELSNKVGCQLFDGQANVFITKDNIELLITEFQKTSGKIIGLVNQIKREGE